MLLHANYHYLMVLNSEHRSSNVPNNWINSLDLDQVYIIFKSATVAPSFHGVLFMSCLHLYLQCVGLLLLLQPWGLFNVHIPLLDVGLFPTDATIFCLGRVFPIVHRIYLSRPAISSSWSSKHSIVDEVSTCCSPF